MANAQDEKKPEQPSNRTGEFNLPLSGEVVVQHDDLPEKPPDDKKIHPRRPLPLVPDASEKDSGGNH